MGHPTRLEAFMESHGIKPMALARASGYSRQYLLRVRKGRTEPGRPFIAAIVDACRKLSHEPVKATDLFDLGGE
ncbi:MAG: helix-turn-helix transcriptional regulator [Acidobacteriota bacterium]